MAIIIVGDGKVGKTSILKRLDKRQFVSQYIRTTGVDFIQTTYTSEKGDEVRVKFWDTAGQDRFRNLTYSFYRQADGIIVAYDVTSLESFKNTRTWISSIQKIVKADEMPRILVGNKTDLIEDRVIDKETAQQFADSYGIKYFETSAYTGDGIQEMMDDIMKQVFEYKVLPEILNPPIKEDPRGQSFGLDHPINKEKREKSTSNEEEKRKPGSCCKSN